MEITSESFTRPQAISQDIPHQVLEQFDCGVVELNEWLRTRAIKNEKYSSSRTYVVFSDDGPLTSHKSCTQAL